MSVSTKFVPRLQQSAGGPGRFWKWQNKLGSNQLKTDSFSTSASVEAGGPTGRWWRWQNRNPTTPVNVNINGSGVVASHTNGFSTSQSVGRMVEPGSIGITIPEASRRIPPLYKIDEEFSVTEILSPEASVVHQEWRHHPGCEMSWHSRQTCGGQVFTEKTSIPLPQSINLLQQEEWTL